MSQESKKVYGPYSPIRRVGQLVFISGQVGVDSETKQAAHDVTSQTQQAMQNMSSILLSDGLSLQNIVKTTIYLKNMADFGAVNDVYGSYFQEPFPARACVEVAGLPRVAGETELLVEIEAIAQIGGGDE